jgi:hypothetical protein
VVFTPKSPAVDVLQVAGQVSHSVLPDLQLAVDEQAELYRFREMDLALPKKKTVYYFVSITILCHVILIYHHIMLMYCFI